MVQEVVTNPGIGQAIAATTAAVGVGGFLQLLPPILSIIATIFGIVLSGVLIYSHWANGRAERKKLEAETALANAKRKGLEKD
jgi:hypothetical protein